MHVLTVSICGYRQRLSPPPIPFLNLVGFHSPSLLSRGQLHVKRVQRMKGGKVFVLSDQGRRHSRWRHSAVRSQDYRWLWRRIAEFGTATREVGPPCQSPSTCLHVFLSVLNIVHVSRNTYCLSALCEGNLILDKRRLTTLSKLYCSYMFVLHPHRHRTL